MSVTKAARPLYLQIAHRLEQRIMDGTYPVGTLLPTESDLCKAFGASRHTVRQAIEQLKRRGALTARKGIGTKVEARDVDWRDRFRAQTRNDLFDLSQDTELHFDLAEDVVLGAAQAKVMGIRPGAAYFHAAGLRYFAGDDAPFCFNEVYLHDSVAEVLRGVDVLRESLFTMVERYTGERIAAIQQTIEPVEMVEDVRAALDAEPGTLALRMARRYLSPSGRLLEYAVQILPSDRFTYRTILASAPDESRDMSPDGLEAHEAEAAEKRG